MQTRVIGIDPGVTGGMAVLINGEAWAAPMPVLASGPKGRNEVDVAAVVAFAVSEQDGNPVMVVLEHPQPNPVFGAQNFTFGEHYGFWRGLFAAYTLRVLTPRPQAWQKAMGITGKGKARKDEAIALCAKLFPSVKLVLPGCRKAHDGMADALLLAEWGRRQSQ